MLLNWKCYVLWLQFLLSNCWRAKSSFLTDDVSGKVSVVQILGDVDKLFATFEKEWLVYKWISTQRRKKISVVLQGLKQVKLDPAEFGTLMARGSERVTQPDLILILDLTAVISDKLKALIVLISKLAIFEGQLRKVLRMLQICNSQMHAQVFQHCRQGWAFVVPTQWSFSGKILLEFLKLASECNRSLGSPLTLEQLVLCAEKMKQRNALQLEQLVDDLNHCGERKGRGWWHG